MTLDDYLRALRTPYADNFSLGLWLGNAIANCHLTHHLEVWELGYISNVARARARGISA